MTETEEIVEAIHCNPPMHTMSPEGRWAIRAIIAAAEKQMTGKRRDDTIADLGTLNVLASRLRAAGKPIMARAVLDAVDEITRLRAAVTALPSPPATP